MERRREGGRFVREQAGEAAPKRKALVRAPRPAQCRVFVLKRIAEAMPNLIDTLIEKAEQGSYQHMSILARMAGLHMGERAAGKTKPRRNGVAAMLIKQLEKASAGDSVKGPKVGLS